MVGMAFIGSNVVGEVGLRLLLSPLGSKTSNIVIRTACCSVGVAIPVYSTFKAIERKDHNAQQRWLVYWAAYGSFSLIEIFSDKVVSWCPMYYHLKFAFLVWLQLPSTNGAKHLYVKHLRPFFLRHQAKVDQVLGLGYNEAVKLLSSHQTEIQFVRSVILKITGTGSGRRLRDAGEPDRSQQPSPAEEPVASPDDESDRNDADQPEGSNA